MADSWGTTNKTSPAQRSADTSITARLAVAEASSQFSGQLQSNVAFAMCVRVCVCVCVVCRLEKSNKATRKNEEEKASVKCKRQQQHAIVKNKSDKLCLQAHSLPLVPLRLLQTPPSPRPSPHRPFAIRPINQAVAKHLKVNFLANKQND